jgi:hypothetical protein
VTDELLDEVDAKAPSRKGWEDLENSHQPPVVRKERVINFKELNEAPKPNKLRGSSLLTLNKNQGFFSGDQEDMRRRPNIQIEE